MAANIKEEIKIEKTIVILETTDREEVEAFLKDRGILFKINNCISFEAKPISNIEICEEKRLVLINPENYSKLNLLSEVTGLPIFALTNRALIRFFETIDHNPLACLESLYGSLNLMNIFEIIRINIKNK